MTTNSFILIHKSPSILNSVFQNIVGFCVSSEFIDNNKILIDVYLDKDELISNCKKDGLIIFEVEKTVMDLDSILDKISTSSVESLNNEEMYFLKTLY